MCLFSIHPKSIYFYFLHVLTTNNYKLKWNIHSYLPHYFSCYSNQFRILFFIEAKFPWRCFLHCEIWGFISLFLSLSLYIYIYTVKKFGNYIFATIVFFVVIVCRLKLQDACIDAVLVSKTSLPVELHEIFLLLCLVWHWCIWALAGTHKYICQSMRARNCVHKNRSMCGFMKSINFHLLPILYVFSCLQESPHSFSAPLKQYIEHINLHYLQFKDWMQCSDYLKSTTRASE